MGIGADYRLNDIPTQPRGPQPRLRAPRSWYSDWCNMWWGSEAALRAVAGKHVVIVDYVMTTGGPLPGDI